MATVSIVLTTSNTVTRWGADIRILKSQPKAKQVATSSASSATSTITTASALSDVWVVTAKGGDIWVKFGTAPTASSGNDWLVMAGTTREFGVSVDGELLAYIDG